MLLPLDAALERPFNNFDYRFEPKPETKLVSLVS